MKIGELARKTGLTRDTIRFYEREGLIASQKSESNTNNYRDYPDKLVAALAFIGEARGIGMSISDLREMLRAAGGNCTKDDALQILNLKTKELEESRAKTLKVIAFLKKTKKRVQKFPNDGRNLVEHMAVIRP